MPPYGWLATTPLLVLVVVGAAVASLGFQLLFPLGHKPIKDLVMGVVLLTLGVPLLVFSMERLRRERRSRARARVQAALQRRDPPQRTEGEYPWLVLACFRP